MPQNLSVVRGVTRERSGRPYSSATQSSRNVCDGSRLGELVERPCHATTRPVGQRLPVIKLFGGGGRFDITVCQVTTDTDVALSACQCANVTPVHGPR